MEKGNIIFFGSLVIVFLLIFTISSCAKRKPINENDLGFAIKSLKENEVIRAEKLWNAYIANKEKADNAYRDKVILVSGKVRFFTPKRKTKDNTPSIILGKGSLVKGVQCMFAGSNINEIAPDIKIGDELTIKGKCIGKIVNVFLSNCEIVTPDSIQSASDSESSEVSTVIPPAEEMILISAVDLWNTYQVLGAFKAHEKFYNKKIQVKGVIRFMGPPRFWRGNTSFIILETGVETSSPILGIQCEFEGNFLSNFPTLKKGDEVTIEGIGSSKFTNVFIKNCKIVDVNLSNR
jgi:hypothetical protein